ANQMTSATPIRRGIGYRSSADDRAFAFESSTLSLTVAFPKGRKIYHPGRNGHPSYPRGELGSRLSARGTREEGTVPTGRVSACEYMRISEVKIYPVKSLRGVAVKDAVVEERGFRYDRRWMLVDGNNRFLTQREHPGMALVTVAVGRDGLVFKRGSSD